MFGVTTTAMPKSSAASVDTASPAASTAPLVATITGSTTMFFAPFARRRPAIARAASPSGTIPIFTASGTMSAKTASTCAAII